MMSQKLWVVGEWLPKWTEAGWHLIGVFDDEALARKACEGQDFFVGPITTNEAHIGSPSGDGVLDGTLYPSESRFPTASPTEWPGLCYPSREVVSVSGSIEPLADTDRTSRRLGAGGESVSQTSIPDDSMFFSAKHGEKLLAVLGFPLGKIKYGSLVLHGEENGVIQLTVTAFVTPTEIAEARKS